MDYLKIETSYVVLLVLLILSKVQNINCCQGNPCLNGGTCNGLYCVCLPGFYGPQCEIYITPCSSRPCQNGGTCVALDSSKYKCECPPFFWGPNCEWCYTSSTQSSSTSSNIVTSPIQTKSTTTTTSTSTINLCANMNCINNGLCIINWDGNPFCLCPIGFQGTYCHINVCSPSPCYNNGVCTATSNSFYCTCFNGYTGLRCEIEPNTPSKHPTTSTKITTSTSTTLFIYTSTIKSPCYSNPCQNNGICHDINQYQYVCTCTNSFTGQNCQTYLNYCQPTPCYNGGTCVQTSSLYICNCPNGFYGTQCNNQVNPCKSNPCLNNGVCQSTGYNQFRCDCCLGYTGNLCQIPPNPPLPPTPSPPLPPPYVLTNPCFSSPCLNDGICRSGVYGYKCTCKPNYTGINCQFCIIFSNSHKLLLNSSLAYYCLAFILFYIKYTIM